MRGLATNRVRGNPYRVAAFRSVLIRDPSHAKVLSEETLRIERGISPNAAKVNNRLLQIF